MRGPDPLRPSRSRPSTAITTGSTSLVESPRYSVTLGATALVVRMTVGDVSASTALTRSSCAPNDGTDSGTAISPACIAPRKAAM